MLGSAALLLQLENIQIDLLDLESEKTARSGPEQSGTRRILRPSHAVFVKVSITLTQRDISSYSCSFTHFHAVTVMLVTSELFQLCPRTR